MTCLSPKNPRIIRSERAADTDLSTFFITNSVAIPWNEAVSNLKCVVFQEFLKKTDNAWRASKVFHKSAQVIHISALHSSHVIHILVNNRTRVSTKPRNNGPAVRREASGTTEADRKMTRLRREMERRRLGALFVTHLPNVRYLSGFTGSNALLLVKARSAILFTDARYTEQAAQEVGRLRVEIARVGTLAHAVRATRALAGVAAVGFDAGRVPVSHLRAWKALFPGLRFRDASGCVDQLRAVKTRDEIDGIRRAAAVTEGVFAALLGMIRPGVSERDLAAEITYRHRLAGAERDAFEPIVGSGPRAALIHGQPSDRRIAQGDVLLLDFGCTVDGWCSDVTRTVAVGRIPKRLRNAHASVLRAHDAAIEAARPGLRGRELDAIARDVLRRDRLDTYFTHSLGHGLGLEVHELPRISMMSDDVLEAGMVATIEPGVYLPGLGGIRIEDDIAITSSGAEVLTSGPAELIEL
jgi:Xaa-Pro aminopeptidase